MPDIEPFTTCAPTSPRSEIGQPLLIDGTMGTASYVLVGMQTVNDCRSPRPGMVPAAR